MPRTQALDDRDRVALALKQGIDPIEIARELGLTMLALAELVFAIRAMPDSDTEGKQRSNHGRLRS